MGLLVGCGADSSSASNTTFAADRAAVASGSGATGNISGTEEPRPVPKCTECGLNLVHVVTLGKASDPELITRGAAPVRDSKGRFFLVGTSGRIAVYDSTGQQTSVFGKIGQGPGEISCEILYVRLGREDSLHTLGRCQHMVFDADHRFVRSTSVPAIMNGAVILPDGRPVVYSTIRTEDAFGFPLHLLASDGTIAKSFGSETREVIPSCENCLRRLIALSHDSATIWAMPLNRYQLERWNLDGTLAQTIVNRKSRWFHEWQPIPAVRGAVAAPGPVRSLPNIRTTIVELVATDNNALLIHGTTPDASVSALLPNGKKLEPVRSQAEAAERRANPSPSEWFPSRATVIDLFDLDRAEVVATGKWPGVQIQLLDGHHAFWRREDPDGRVLIDIFRIVRT